MIWSYNTFNPSGFHAEDLHSLKEIRAIEEARMLENLQHIHTDLSKVEDDYTSEEDCAFSLFAARWPNGFRCPVCEGTQCYRITTRRLPLYECRSCNHQTSVTAGTIFEKSRTPLRKWFQAIYLASTAGISAVKLQKVIGVTYKTAWLILAKIRYAISNEDARKLLTGVVKVNPASYKGITCMGRVTEVRQRHPLLVGATVQPEDRLQTVKIKVIPDSELSHTKNSHLPRPAREGFIRRYIDPNAEHVDCITEPRLFRLMCKPLRVFAREAVHRINQVHHGIGIKHFQAYLDEFCFRFNARNVDVPLFAQLQTICISCPPMTYSSIKSRPKYVKEA